MPDRINGLERTRRQGADTGRRDPCRRPGARAGGIEAWLTEHRRRSRLEPGRRRPRRVDLPGRRQAPPAAAPRGRPAPLPGPARDCCIIHTAPLRLRHQIPREPAASAAQLGAIASDPHSYEPNLRKQVLKALPESRGPYRVEWITLRYLVRYGDRVHGHPAARDCNGRAVAVRGPHQQSSQSGSSDAPSSACAAVWATPIWGATWRSCWLRAPGGEPAGPRLRACPLRRSEPIAPSIRPTGRPNLQRPVPSLAAQETTRTAMSAELGVGQASLTPSSERRMRPPHQPRTTRRLTEF